MSPSKSGSPAAGDSRGAWLGSAAAAAALLMVGPALPLGWGWLPPLLVLAAFGAWSRFRPRPGLLFSMASLSRPARLSYTALSTASAAVFCAVATMLAGALWVAFGGVIWVVLPLTVGALVSSRVTSGRAAPVLSLAFALAVPAVAVFGARYEAAAPQARAEAYTGPIHGIHPFQITAVRIDGFGPFDIPFNDYVEPDGNRGYGPQAYADAMERALHDIATVHFADGPARAYAAFAGAEVEAIETPAVEETLGKSPGAETHHRLRVRSGGWGRRSSVEFLCPGRRDDPRGPQPDNIMNRMCPSKYASEGSAGLGVTGRWPGYVEFRGMERTGWSRVLGATRTDDEAGRRVTAHERRISAWILLGLGMLLALRPGSRAVATGAAVTAGWVSLLGLVAVVLIAVGGEPSVGRIGPLSGPTGIAASAVTDWLPLLLVAGVGSPLVATRRDAGRLGGAWVTLFLAAGTVLVAQRVSASTWVFADLWPSLVAGGGAPEPLQAWVEGAAQLVGPRWGLSIFEMEHAIAGCLLAMLIGFGLRLLTATSADVAAVWSRDVDKPFSIETIPGHPMLWALTIALVAAAFVISRKTDGGATLLSSAVGLSFVLQSAVSVAAAPRGSVWGRASAALLVVAVAITCGLLVLLPSSSPDGLHNFVLLCVCGGLAAALSGLTFLRKTRDSTA